MKNKKITIILLSLTLILPSISLVQANNKEKKDEISPLTNQGLIIEINRIRNRDLLNKILKPGFQWRIKPTFYLEIDFGKETYPEKKPNTVFKTWDTINKDFRILKDVEEELPKINFTINVKEKNIFKNNYKTVETIEINYSFLTGKWNGSDYFKDKDGYGHFLGEKYEIWFDIYQTDYDHDKIPYWAEVNILGTDPMVDDSKLDPDNDGIPTSWEYKWGYDPFTWDDHQNLDPDVDGLENIEEYMMRKHFSNPYQQDIYIEADGMKSRFFFWEHKLFKETQQIIIERFAEHGINVYIDDGWPDTPTNGGGSMVPFDDRTNWNSGEFLQYYKHYFPDERKGIFRYLLICNNAGYAGNSEFNNFDTIILGNSIRTTFLNQKAFFPRTQRTMLASAVLHELGHTLGIGPNTIEGCDNYSFKNKFLPTQQRNEYLEEWGNYKSVMNYYYIYNKNLVDFSDGTNGYNDQNDWNHFYLPYFQIETTVVCDPFINITEKGVKENITMTLPGWNYSKKLTIHLMENMSQASPVDPIKSNWGVFIKTDQKNATQPSDRNIRVYVQPIVPLTGWSLYKEGYIDTEENITLV